MSENNKKQNESSPTKSNSIDQSKNTTFQVDSETAAAICQKNAIAEFDLDGKLLDANAEFLDLLGESIENIRSKEYFAFCDSDYLSQQDYRNIWVTLSNAESVKKEICQLTKSGEKKWVEVVFTPVEAHGSIVKIVGFATNIDEVVAQKIKDRSIYSALNTTQAIIEFDVEGNVVNANDNFLNALGYELAEIVGKHHKIFCDHDYVETEEYKEFWKTLRGGEHLSDDFKRFKKSGESIWIKASYNPIYDNARKIVGFVKFATDITASKLSQKENESKLNAIESSQAVIEFEPSGVVIRANDNFKGAMGYGDSSLAGVHHRIFCDKEYVESIEYREFWRKLNAGEHFSGEFSRLAKDGSTVWINATYNPVVDDNGDVYKIVKIASDITALKTESLENASKMSALDRSQAVIEFDLDGNILTANDAFLQTLNYQLSEIQGKHHSIFCAQDYINSEEYKDFWAKLKLGNFDSGRYMRLARDNSEVWINASYNPLFDEFGNPYKVVKFATNITTQIDIEKDVRRLAEEFSGSAVAISEKSGDVASSAKSLGANTEEMNAAVEELTASIDSIASNSKNADSMAHSTQEAAELGAKAISDSIEAMDLIKKSSEGIGEIVMVISEIASQTNLLAFNAAIEAARAGEHGLGFSVVADEVRKLAERSSQATKEITQLINESVKRVQQGSDTSQDAVNSFKNIVSGVQETTQAISEISCAAEEQLIAAREVSTSIQQISEASENSAITAEGIAQATSQLTNGASELLNNANKFAA